MVESNQPSFCSIADHGRARYALNAVLELIKIFLTVTGAGVFSDERRKPYQWYSMSSRAFAKFDFHRGYPLLQQPMLMTQLYE